MTGQRQRATFPAGNSRTGSAVAYANAVAVALATRRTRTLCAGCGHRPCRCVSITPAELTALRDALAAVTTGAERPALGPDDRSRLMAALTDAACWRTMSAYALCSTGHVFPDDAVGLCCHNSADLQAAAAYRRLARWLAAFAGWHEGEATDSPSADVS